MEKKIIIHSVLIPDGESHFLNYIINCLAEIPKVLIYIMTDKKNVAIRYSRYVHHTSFYERLSDLEWISNINNELEKYSIQVILPISERGIRALSLYRNHIRHPNRLGLLPDVSDLDITLNKWLLAKHLKDVGISHPESIFLSVSNNQPELQFDTLSFPIILKPTTQTGGGLGIHLFENKESLKLLSKKVDRTKDYVLQKYIRGIDFCCNIICENGDIFAHTIQQHTLHGNRKFAPQLGLQFVENATIHAMVRKLMKSLKWSGVANIDLRYDIENNAYYIIEVNPRFWGSVEGSMLAGINFPRLYVSSALGVKVEETSYDKMEYLNLKGLLSRIKSRPHYVFRWKQIWRQTPIRFVFRDAMFYLVRILRKVFSSLKIS